MVLYSVLSGVKGCGRETIVPRRIDKFEGRPLRHDVDAVGGR